MSNVVVEFTTGGGGSGKTYRRCAHQIVNLILNPKCPSADVIWSNFPIEFEPWTDSHGTEQPGLFAIAEKLYGLESWEVEEKVKVFPKDVVDSWLRFDRKRNVVTPMEFFTDEDIKLDAAHIAIDEIHNFCPQGDNKASAVWSQWLGEIRHEGATIEFLTQHPAKVSKAIVQHATIRRQLVTSSLRRDWFFNIQLDDWYNVLTIFGRGYKPSVWEIEEKEELGKFKIADQMPFWFEKELYGVYNSHSSSNVSGRSGAGQKKPFESMDKTSLLFWFLKRNGWRLIINRRVAAILFVVAIFFAPRLFKTASTMLGKRKPTTKEVVAMGEEISAKELKLKAELKALVARQDKKIAEVLKHVEKFDGADRIVAMTPSSVIYATGQRGSIGDAVLHFDGSKKVIKEISYANRFVEYDDSSRDFFNNSYGMLARASKTTSSTAELRKHLHSDEDVAAKGTDGSDDRKEDNSFDIRMGSGRRGKISR